jgi:hypothetical protein
MLSMFNRYTVKNGVVELITTRDLLALCDERHLPRLLELDKYFSLIESGILKQCKYLKTKVKVNNEWKSLLFHHFLFGSPPSDNVTDHINGNGLDNRDSNVRFVLQSVNNHRKKYYGDLPPGVVKNVGGSFSAKVMKDGIYHHLGSFPTAELAGKAYEDKSKELYGE